MSGSGATSDGQSGAALAEQEEEPTRTHAPYLDVHPRLRHDVVFADTGEGALVRHADNGFILKGRTIYKWLAAIAPGLTGEYTVEELCGGLGDDQRRMVVDVVRTLIDRGFVRDLTRADADELPDAIQRRFAEQLNFIEHYSNDAPSRFARYRSARVLVTGVGEMACSAVSALLRNGLAVVDVRVDRPESERDVVTAIADDVAAEGVDAHARVVEPASLDLRGYDVVLAVAEDLGPAATLELAERAQREGPTVIPAVVVGDVALVGPLIEPTTRAGWASALLRLEQARGNSATAALWRSAALRELPQPAQRSNRTAARMLGNAMAYEVFRLRTDCIEPETRGAMMIQNMQTAEIWQEPLFPHPAAPECAGVAPVAKTLAPDGHGGTGDADGSTPDDMERARYDETIPLVQPHVGIFSGFDDAQTDQSPVKVGRVRLGITGANEVTLRTITAFDVSSTLAARNRAVTAAAQVYSDRVRRFARQPSRRLSQRCVPPQHLQTWTGIPAAQDGDLDMVAGKSLVADDQVDVPAAAALPSGPGAEPGVFELTPAGGGCASNRADAIAKGLQSAFTYRALRSVVDGTPGEVMRSEDAAESCTTELAFLRRCLERGVENVELVALPDAEPFHVVLARGRSRHSSSTLHWSVGASVQREEAVQAALRDLVGNAQLHEAGVSIDLGDPLIPGFDPRCLRVKETTTSAASPDTADTRVVDVAVDHLRRTGQEAIVVDITPPDFEASGRLVAVRVLLTGKERA